MCEPSQAAQNLNDFAAVNNFVTANFVRWQY